MSGTIRRGKAIRSDLANWDGLTATTTRLDASGGTVTGLSIGNEVDVLQVYGLGTDRTRSTINSAIQQIGAGTVTLVFAPGTWTIDASLTIPSNFSCRIPAGCVFSVSSGQTLTFSGPVFADSSAFYTGSGTVSLSTDSVVGGQVWLKRTAAEIAAGVTPTNYAYEHTYYNVKRNGATGDGSTDDRTAFFNSNAAAGSLLVPRGNYRIASNLTIGRSIHFEHGAILVPDAGVTITINGAICAGPYQIFNTAAAGSLIRGTLPGDVFVNWWGATDDNSSDNGDEIRAAAATVAARNGGIGLGGGGRLRFPYTNTGVYRYSGTLYFYGNYVKFIGDTIGVWLRKTDSGTAIGASPDSHTVGLYTYYYNCGYENLFLYSESADVGLDISGFQYSDFSRFEIQLKGSNRKCIMGKGEQGSSPYYNTFNDYALFGDNNGSSITGSVGISFEEGAWTGGSNGPNANQFNNQRRAAALDYMFDLKAGQGNFGTNISAESIHQAYFRFNSRSADDSGTSTGSNSENTLVDTGAGWTVNDWIGAAVKITGGTGSGQIRRIGSNNTTTLTLTRYWTTNPDNTSTYEIYRSKVSGNKFLNVRGEGLSTSNPDFIQALPGTNNSKVSNYAIESLGSGAVVVDDQKDPSNSFWDGDLIALTYTSTGLSAGATTELTPAEGASVFQGGFGLTGSFIVEAVHISCEGRSAGTATVEVNVDGSYSLTGILNADHASYVYIPGNNTEISGSGKKIHCEVVTDGSWAPTTADLAVIVLVRLIR